MKQILKIRLEPGEAHVAACAEEAFSLVGGPSWPGCDDRHQPFRRIRGNDFTAQDVARAGEIARAAAQSLRMKAADEPCPFPEIPGQGGLSRKPGGKDSCPTQPWPSGEFPDSKP